MRNLVEYDRALLRCFETSGPGFNSSGERAALVTARFDSE